MDLWFMLHLIVGLVGIVLSFIVLLRTERGTNNGRI